MHHSVPDLTNTGTDMNINRLIRNITTVYLLAIAQMLFLSSKYPKKDIQLYINSPVVLG
ncbi:ATP-dependent Clp protease proteolytic subunit, partial [candidate division KSB1 bacterium]|nr:ATP-dependent Clp protease proteolytic subunit [candidate division KSB1 bacterium]